MSDSERNELEAIAEVAVDVAADAVIAEADADFADLAVDAAAELEQDLELEEAIAEVAEVEAAVAVGAHREQFWIEGGEIALPIHAEDGERPVEFVLIESPIKLNQLDHLFEFP